ncbi:ABC transporter permease [Oerskovia sp. M15]
MAGRITEATLTGIVDMGASMAGASIVFFDEATAAEAFAPDGMVSTLSVLAEDGVGEQELADRIAGAIDDAAASTADPVEVVTGETARDEAREDIASQLGFIETFLLVFAGISLFVGGFIIANTFAMTVRQRQRELALLRAVGASPLQVFASILVQAAVIGALGGALGVLGVWGSSRRSSPCSGRWAWSSRATSSRRDDRRGLARAGCGRLGRVGRPACPTRGARRPGRGHARRLPAQAGSLRVRGIVGAVVAGRASGRSCSRSSRQRPTRPRAPGAPRPRGARRGRRDAPARARPRARRPARHVRSVRRVGQAPRDARARQRHRNPRRTASTASALMIGMSLVGAASVLAVSMQASMKSIVADESLADLVVESATGTVPRGRERHLDAARGRCGRLDDGRPVLRRAVLGRRCRRVDPVRPRVDPGVFGRTWQTETVEGSLDSLADGQVSVLKATASDEGWLLGDELTLRTEQGSVDVTIGSIFDSPALGVPVIVPDTVFAELSVAPAEMSTLLLVKAADGVTQAELDAAVTAAAEPYMIVSVMDDEEYVSALASQIDQMLMILYALLGLSIIIAVLGIVNTLALSVIERTREIGLLRAVGLGRSQLAGTIVIESVLTAVFGTLLGLAVGVGLAAAMPTVFASTGFTALAIPWAGLGTMVGIAVLVGVLAAGGPRCGLRACRCSTR